MMTILNLAILICVAISMYAVFVVASKRPTRNSLFLVICSVCCAGTTLAYFFEVNATMMESMLISIKIGYIFKLFALVAYFYFIIGYCEIKLPIAVLRLAFLFCVSILAFVQTCQNHTLYYRSIQIVADGLYPHIVIEPGPIYYLMVAGLLGFVVTAEYLVIRKVTTRKDPEDLKRLKLLMAVPAMPVIGILLQLMFRICYVDVIPFAFGIALVVLIILVKKYGILGTLDVAKDTIVENAQEGIFVIDNSYNVIYRNGCAREKYGELEKRMITEGSGFIKQLLAQSESVLDTEEGHCEIRVSPLYQNGVLYGHAIWIFNMEFINKYTNEMISMKEVAERENMEKTNFLANMSHEIRTPINAILGFNELILDESHEQVIQEYAKDVKSAGRNLMSIIDKILDISKIDSGDVVLVDEPYYVQSLIQDSVSVIKLQATQKELIINTEISPELPYQLIGDKNHIQRVLTNILNNAVKFTERGSINFKITSEPMDDDQVKLIFEVRDTGIGIREEDLKKLYQKFTRFDRERNFMIEGTGLGMAICSGIVEQMHGEIAVESTYGEGSCFTVVIPQKVTDGRVIADNVRPEHLEAEEQHFMFHCVAKVLVVDDNQINLELVDALLSKYGLDLDMANNGYEAIEYAKNNEYDLIFMDHMMPGMDGIEAMHRIRALGGEHENQKIICLTANTIVGVKEQMVQEGFNGFLSKPIDISELEMTLLAMLPEHMITKLEERTETMDSQEELKQYYKIRSVLKHFDVDEGIKFCGGQEGYEEILNIVYESAETEMNNIRSYYDNGDWKNYILRAHAVKSSMASIGAKEISELARTLEMAGKEENYDVIHQSTQYFLDMFRVIVFEIAQALDKYNQSRVELPMITEPEVDITVEEAKGLLEEIVTMTKEFRHDKAMDIVDDILAMKLDDCSREWFENTRTMLREYRFADIEEYIGKIMEQQ